VDEETVVEDYHLTEAHLDFSIRQKAILVAGADPNIFAAAPKEVRFLKKKFTRDTAILKSMLVGNETTHTTHEVEVWICRYVF
jgi:hypothetical protein